MGESCLHSTVFQATGEREFVVHGCNHKLLSIFYHYSSTLDFGLWASATSTHTRIIEWAACARRRGTRQETADGTRYGNWLM